MFLADRNLPIYSTSEFSSFVVFRRVNLLICDNTPGEVMWRHTHSIYGHDTIAILWV